MANKIKDLRAMSIDELEKKLLELKKEQLNLRIQHSTSEALEMVATLVLLGTPEPDSVLHAFLMRTAAGGVLVMKVKERSA